MIIGEIWPKPWHSSTSNLVPEIQEQTGKIQEHSQFSEKNDERKSCMAIPSMQWHDAIKVAVHNYNTFPSALNGYSPFIFHFGREDSNLLWNKLNPGNTVSCKVT